MAWKSLGSTVLSNDGQWFGYRLTPQEGDAEVVVKAVKADKTLRFPIGEVRRGAAAAAAAAAPAGATSALAFSDDGKWVAFTTYPTHAAAQRLKRQRRPIQSSVMVVNLATGEKKEYPKIRRFAFSGESAAWIALQRYGPDAPGGGGGAAPAGGGRGAGAAAGGGSARIARAAPISSSAISRKEPSSTSATSASSRSARTASCSRWRSTRRTRRATACSCAT